MTSIVGPDQSFPDKTGHIFHPESNEPVNGFANAPSTSHALGNFDRIWEFLGESPSALPPLNGSTKPEGFVTNDNESFESETPAFVESGTKSVKWRDHIEGADLADIDELKPNDLACLNKWQRKKARRRIRKQTEAEQHKAFKESPTEKRE